MEDMLPRRNSSNLSRYSMCLEEEEYADLLVHRRWVSSLMNLSPSIVGVSSVQPSN